MGIRPGTLDAEVDESKRPPDDDIEAVLAPVEALEPWPEEVDGAALVVAIRRNAEPPYSCCRTVAPTSSRCGFSARTATTPSDCFRSCWSRRRSKRCGKTTLLECIEAVSRSAGIHIERHRIRVCSGSLTRIGRRCCSTKPIDG